MSEEVPLEEEDSPNLSDFEATLAEIDQASALAELDSPTQEVPPSEVLGNDAEGRRKRALLDKCYNYQGYRALELATIHYSEVPALGKQLAAELAIPHEKCIDDALEHWIDGARDEAPVQLRLTGVLKDPLIWMGGEPLRKVPRIENYVVIDGPAPLPRERNRKLLLDGCIQEAREERLLATWVKNLQKELKECDAPVLRKLEGSLNPARAAELIVGRTRASTLKRYVTIYRQWRPWLAEAKLRMPPGRSADLVDYLLARSDEPCGRTVPEAIYKGVAWLEKVAEFTLEDRATYGRLVLDAKDRITEELSREAPLTKRAPRYPLYVLLAPVGLRIWAWAKKVKVWASLRWSDIQAILPHELTLIEGRLTTTLRRIKELPVCVSEHAYLENPAWLKTGFDLLKDAAPYKRDYLLPRLGPGCQLEKKMATYPDAMVATAALQQAMLLPTVLQGFWTERSERAVLPTGLSLHEPPPADKDRAGSRKGLLYIYIYARTFAGRVAKLQAMFAEMARSGKPYDTLDERVARTLASPGY